MDMELVTEGLEFPEGPIAMADGSVVLVEIKRKTLTRVLPDGTQEIIAKLGGGPNGAAIGPDGAVYVCNNGGFQWLEEDGLTLPHGTPDDYVTGSIQRVDLADGSVTTVYDECDGIKLRGPNDIVFDADGGFWFTDLGKNNGDVSHAGHVLYGTIDGKKIVRAHNSMVTPNGIGLSPDGKTLHVAETTTGRLWSFPVEGPGQIAGTGGIFSPGQVMGPLPGYQLFDSLGVEANGRVCVATLVNGGITSFDPNDGTWEQYSFPDPITTNICFGGDDMRTAFVTCSATGKLYKVRWPRPGLKLNFNA